MSNKPQFLSLESSKKLLDMGCSIQSEYGYWSRQYQLDNGDVPSVRKLEIGCNHNPTLNNDPDYDVVIVPTFDLMHDICILHSKDFFSVEKDINNQPYYKHASHTILTLLQNNNPNEAEEFFLQNTSFNNQR